LKTNFVANVLSPVTKNGGNDVGVINYGRHVRCCRIRKQTPRRTRKVKYEMTNLEEAKARLEQLQIERTDLEDKLNQAINDPDPDPSRIIALRKQIDENSVYTYAQRSRILRIEKQKHIDDRAAALTKREQLEERYEALARQVELAQKHLQETWEQWQAIGIKIFALSSRAENARQAIGDYTKQLGQHIANWKRDSMIEQLAGESVCDY
jgi:predicted  nucleic acid-binding Zn-ribbon protein